MSRILRRPMFRGGGKVSSYGNGIASGLANGGMPGKRGLVTGPGGYAGELFGGKINANVPQAQYTGGATNTGGNILTRNLNKLKNLNFNKFIPTKAGITNALTKGMKIPLVGAAGTYGAAAGLGTGIGQLTDFYAKSTSTPEGYRRLKEMGGPKMTFDETNIDVGQDLDYIAQGNMIGKKPGFFPRGGKAKFYEDRGYNPDGTLKKILEDQANPANEAEKNPGVEINVNDKGEPTEPVESRKDRLKRTAKEYQEILGDGIKKDSIFDAMVEGGSRLYEGEGLGSSLRAANKALDPIQNIKTASRKLALEEDIAMRKAMAVSAGKSTEMSRRIAAMRAAGRTPEQIADMVAGIKPETLGEKVSKLGKVDGYAEYIKENQPDVEVVTSKVDVSKKPDGKYYIADKFTIVEVKDGAVVVGSEKIIKNS